MITATTSYSRVRSSLIACCTVALASVAEQSTKRICRGDLQVSGLERPSDLLRQAFASRRADSSSNGSQNLRR